MSYLKEIIIYLRSNSFIVKILISVVVTGKNFSGHENRAVYICGVHACCPKQTFKNLILEALASNSGLNLNQAPLPAPERIVIAQPIWSTRNIEKFERYFVFLCEYIFLIGHFFHYYLFSN